MLHIIIADLKVGQALVKASQDALRVPQVHRGFWMKLSAELEGNAGFGSQQDPASLIVCAKIPQDAVSSQQPFTASGGRC